MLGSEVTAIAWKGDEGPGLVVSLVAIRSAHGTTTPGAMVGPGGPCFFEGVRAIHLRTGKLAWKADPPEGLTWYDGRLSRYSDVDGDGVEEVVLLGRYDNRVWILSGRTGVTLRGGSARITSRGIGSCLVTEADVDGDGTRDFIVGCPGDRVGSFKPGDEKLGPVRVLSGKSLAIIRELPAPALARGFGASMAVVRSGKEKAPTRLAIGSPLTPGESRTLSGSLYLCEMSDGKVNTEVPTNGGGRFGEVAAPLDDINGDGYSDVLVGAPWEIPGGGRSAGEVRALSGKDGTTQWSRVGKKWPR